MCLINNYQHKKINKDSIVQNQSWYKNVQYGVVYNHLVRPNPMILIIFTLVTIGCTWRGVSSDQSWYEVLSTPSCL